MYLIQSARFNQAARLIDALMVEAQETGRRTRRAVYEPPTGRYRVLRPGVGTPLWNELAQAARSHLRRRGDKAVLARILGLPRQRLHLLLTAKTACPDAERTLLLLVWVGRKQRAAGKLRRPPRQPSGA